MSLRVGFFLVYLFSLLLIRCQPSSYRLPSTIKPINYKLELHPDIPNSIVNGKADIQINVTEAYFTANLDGNFDVSFHYYPGMVIDPIVLQIVAPTDTRTVQLVNELQLNETTQIAKATFDITKASLQQLLPTATVTIATQYTTAIRGGSDLAGLYKSQYVYNEVTVINLVTQFQATDARSVFPCFDEPAFKATFDITIIASVNALKLSNMPIAKTEASEEPLECIWTAPDRNESTLCEIVTFDTTPVMSTYLVALVIGGYRNVTNNGEDDEVAQTVYYPYIFDEDRAEFALRQSERVLDEFGGSDGFDIPYTDSGISKLDTVGVSDFAAGAMENWGLIVYRTVRLLVDKEISSQSAKTGQLLIIAHELAHQWFGNLVSPNWWDDLWLNEGFATYMATYGGNLVEPEYNLNEQKVQSIVDVMLDDASVFTPRVKQYVSGDPSQIRSQFSSITYQKGMGVINTVANMMGNEEFLESITDYLNQYRFKTATSAQLGAVLDTKQPQISQLIDSFIGQEGFPLISVDTQLNDETVLFVVTQQRFVKEGPTFYESNAADRMPFVTEEMVTEFSEQLWRVPMLWRDAKGERMSVANTENDIMAVHSIVSAHPRVTNDGVEFYLINPVDGDASRPAEGLYNFFRVNYDDTSLKLLVDNWVHIGAANQFAIISDRFALMAAGYITAESYLDFVRTVVTTMLNELSEGEQIPNHPIFNEIIQSLVYIDDIFCELAIEENSSDDRALRGYFRKFAVDLLRRVLRFVVDDISEPFSEKHERCPEDSDCNILQARLLRALVRLEDRAVIEVAYDILFACENRVCEDQRLCFKCDAPVIEDGRYAFVDEDLLPAFFAGVLAFDTTRDTALKELIALYAAVNIEQKTYILNALGAVYSSDKLVQQAIDFIMSDAVRENMKVNALVAMKKCTARRPLWSFMTSPDGDRDRTVFDRLFNTSALFSQEPLTSLANAFASTDRYEQVSAFFAEDPDRSNAGTERIVQQTLENIYARYQWKEQSQAGLQTYMRTYVVSTAKDRMTILEIVIVTIACCVGLMLLVCGFWSVARPNASDASHYKLEQRAKKEASASYKEHSQHGAGQGGGSTHNSMDYSDEVVNRGRGNVDVVEEMPPSSGYGATEAYNYNQLKPGQDGK